MLFLDKKLLNKRILIFGLLSFFLSFGRQTLAQSNSYPDSNLVITIVVPFSAGGSTDKIAQAILEPLANELKTKINLQHIQGLGGSVGTLHVKDSVSDGYTLGISALSAFAAYPALHQTSMQYDPLVDFSYISNIAETAHVLAVNPKLNVANFADFIKLIKSTSKPYDYASAGDGSMPNLLMKELQNQTQTLIHHVPFQGASSAVKATVLGKTMIILDQKPSIFPKIENNKLIPIAVGSANRLSNLPNVPTFAELGYPSVNRTAFYGLVGPKNLDPQIVKTLNTALNKVLSDPKVRKKIIDLGALPTPNAPEQFAKQIKDEFNAYKNIVNTSGLKINY